jgi:transposase
MNSMITIGVDFHKLSSTFKVLSPQGKVLSGKRIENSRQNIRLYLQSIPQPKRIALEATRSWSLFYDSAHDLVEEFHLGHPKKMKAITSSQTKNDANDAQTLAELLHSGYFPHAFISSHEFRQLRDLVRFRSFLAKQRRALRNQIHALIDRHIFPADRPQSFKSVFCKRGLAWLASVELPVKERFILDEALLSFEQFNQRIAKMESFLQTQAPEWPELAWLSTVPGFRKSKVSAFTVLSEVSDISRFRNARSFIHYAGLIPRERSSGEKHRTGRLITDANLTLRTAIIESVFAAIRTDRGLKLYYQKVKEQNCSSAAIVATARKLGYAIYHVLKERRAYRPEKPPAAA